MITTVSSNKYRIMEDDILTISSPPKPTRILGMPPNAVVPIPRRIQDRTLNWIRSQNLMPKDVKPPESRMSFPELIIPQLGHKTSTMKPSDVLGHTASVQPFVMVIGPSQETVVEKMDVIIATEPTTHITEPILTMDQGTSMFSTPHSTEITFDLEKSSNPADQPEMIDVSKPLMNMTELISDTGSKLPQIEPGISIDFTSLPDPFLSLTEPGPTFPSLDSDASPDMQKPTSSEQFSPALGMGTNLEGKLLDDAINSMLSLPEVCQQVASQQHDQCVELKQFQDILSEKQAKLQSVERDAVDLREKVNSLQRRIYLTKEDLHDLGAQSKILHNETDVLLTKKHKIQMELTSKEEEMNELFKVFLDYNEKMKGHKIVVEKVESESDVFKSLEKHRNLVEELKLRKTNLEATAALECDEIEDIGQSVDYQENLAAIETEAKVIRNQIHQEKQKQTEIRKSTEVLHKRNAAQLTRLRKRLQEVQVHNRHWRDQATQLQCNIDGFSP